MALALAVVGCQTLAPPGAAQDCCASLAELPFRALDRAGEVQVDLDAQSPVHHFDTGSSRLAAWRIAGLPRPARLVVSSYRTAAAGSLAERLLPERRQTVLQPTVLLLDARFTVVRRIEAQQPRPSCSAGPLEPAFELQLVIDEPPAQVSYVVVVASEASLQRPWTEVCGLARAGLSPVGRIGIRAETLASDDLPLRAVVPAKWYVDARRSGEVGLWQALTSVTGGLLVLGQERLEFMRRSGTRYQPVFSVPYAQVVRAGPGNRYGRGIGLSVLAPGPASDTRPQLRHHLFEGEPQAREGAADDAELTQLLRERGASGHYFQAVRWSVSNAEVALEVAGGAGSRIGQSAMLGGGVAAMPCGLCQTGACTPEMLGSCAVLFGVGAVLGGGVGVVQELLGAPAAAQPVDPAAMKARAARGSKLAQGGLRQCLADEIARRPAWQDGALAAAPGHPEPGMVVVAPDIEVQVQLQSLVLAPPSGGGDGASAPPSAGLRQLRAEAKLTLAEQGSSRRASAQPRWQSAAHPWTEWVGENSRLLDEVSAEACADLGARLVDAAEAAWRGE